jgi:ribonuclease P protein component
MPADFKAVFASGRRSSDSQLTVIALANGLGYPRLGFAVSSGRVRSAVRRNRLKRIVREYFRAHEDELGGVDLVVLAQAGVMVAEASRLWPSLEKHWKKAGQCVRS